MFTIYSLPLSGCDDIVKNDSKSRFNKELEAWRDDVKFHMEYASRTTAIEEIRSCYETGAATLDLSDLYLTSIPKEIGELAHLEKLNLKGNHLSSLPDSIYDLDHLKELNLSSNQLIFFSPRIGSFQNLENLNLEGNEIKSLSEETFHLSNLKELSL